MFRTMNNRDWCTPIALTADQMEKFRLPDSQRHNWNEFTSSAGIFHGEGILVNSGMFDGMSSSDAREKIVAWLEERKLI